MGHGALTGKGYCHTRFSRTATPQSVPASRC